MAKKKIKNRKRKVVRKSNIISIKKFIKRKKDILKYTYIQGKYYDKKDNLFFDKMPRINTKFKVGIGYFLINLGELYSGKKKQVVRHKIILKRGKTKKYFKDIIKEVSLDHFQTKGFESIEFIGYSISNINIPRKVHIYYSKLAKDKAKKKKGK